MASAATSNILRGVFPAFAVFGALDEFVSGIIIDGHEIFLIPFDG